MSLYWQDRYQPRREPDRIIRLMTLEDVPGALTLSQSVGWEHQARDLERLLYWSPDGCFVMVEDGGLVIGTVSSVSYETELAWIGQMIIAPDRQRQGLGGQLMRAVLDHLITRGTQRIMLDASEAGRPLYRSLGFRELYQVERWQGRASTYLGPRARQMRPADLADILALDTALSGLNRAHILTRLIEEFPNLAWVDYQQGKLEGYLLGRMVQNGAYLGPWMSRSAAPAERLLRVALEQLQGQAITLNIPDSNGRSVVLASNHNLRRIRHCTRMIYGDAQPVFHEPLTELSIASLATG
ncbi:MAG: GNAT family N-acetyltransferase [Chloroflexi bacterium]|nr:GNAT family N-acetyltransferase [Chloroflexota bacterium]